MKFLLIFTFILAVLSQETKPQTKPEPSHRHGRPHRFRDGDRMSVSNPAIRFCQKAGFQTKQLKTKMGQLAVCEPTEGKYIDAWKFFRQMRLKEGEFTLNYVSVDEEGNVVKGDAITLEEIKAKFTTKSVEEVIKELDEERSERRKLRDSEREERIKEREERRKLRDIENTKDRAERRKQWEEKKQKIEKEREERRRVREEKLGEKETKKE